MIGYNGSELIKRSNANYSTSCMYATVHDNNLQRTLKSYQSVVIWPQLVSGSNPIMVAMSFPASISSTVVTGEAS